MDNFGHCTFAAALWLAAPDIARFEAQTIGTWGRRAEGMTYVAISSKHENFVLLGAYVNCLSTRMGCGCGGDIVGKCKSLIHLRKALEERGLIMPEQPFFFLARSCAAPFSQQSKLATARTSRMQIKN